MNPANIILYSTPRGHVTIEVVFHNQTGELQKEATVSILETVQMQGNRINTLLTVNFTQLMTF